MRRSVITHSFVRERLGQVTCVTSVTAMRRKSFRQMSCPIARSLERVGEWWSMLIMRDALHGLRRFDEFQSNLGIAPNMLTRRLDALVEAGLLERRRYCDRPPRHEYVPTARGRDFRPVLLALLAWGNRHFAPEGASVVIVNRHTGAAVDPVLTDPATGHPIDGPDYVTAPGPGAGVRTGQRYAAAGPTGSSLRNPGSRGRKATSRRK